MFVISWLIMAIILAIGFDIGHRLIQRFDQWRNGEKFDIEKIKAVEYQKGMKDLADYIVMRAEIKPELYPLIKDLKETFPELVDSVKLDEIRKLWEELNERYGRKDRGVKGIFKKIL